LVKKNRWNRRNKIKIETNKQSGHELTKEKNERYYEIRIKKLKGNYKFMIVYVHKKRQIEKRKRAKYPGKRVIGFRSNCEITLLILESRVRVFEWQCLCLPS
jgi:hypothetical protein